MVLGSRPHRLASVLLAIGCRPAGTPEGTAPSDPNTTAQSEALPPRVDDSVWADPLDGVDVCVWSGRRISVDRFATIPAPGPEGASCANWSRCEWAVESTADGIVAHILEPAQSENRLPFAPPPEVPGAGYGPVAEVPDGWIVGIDHGEFGGGLWWFSTDGSKRERLSEGNVHTLYPMGPFVWALGGLNHMGLREAEALQVMPGPDGWTTKAVVGGPKSGIEGTGRTGDTVLVSTPYALWALHLDGSATQLAEGLWGGLYANSIARDEDGTIYLGMRHAIARIQRTGETTTEHWLLPPACTTFHQPEDQGPVQCVCDGSSTQGSRPPK